MDNTQPTAQVTYSTTAPTNQNVIATITANEALQEVSGWTLSQDKLKLTKTYTDNTSTNGENITIKDIARNVATVNVKITNIDKIAPTGTVTYKLSENQESCIVTITANEALQEVSGWTLSQDKLKLTKIYTDNTSANGENITIKDIAGNAATVNVKITGIKNTFKIDTYEIEYNYITKIQPGTTY